MAKTTRSTQSNSPSKPPTHLGFIVDGNRRWARARGLPTIEGHRRGFKCVEEVIEALGQTDVKYVSFFLFSTENWNRSAEEVSYLMKLASDTIDSLAQKLHRQHMRLVIMGRPNPVDPKLWQKMLQAEQDTAENQGLCVCICFNYGGHWEIADAARQAHEAGETEWTPENLRKYLYHPEVPDLDLVVRTSGEERISGFQLWRASYAEFLFLDKHFPDMGEADVQAILDEYATRQRRFGK